MSATTWTVSGMTCDHCVRAVHRGGLRGRRRPRRPGSSSRTGAAHGDQRRPARASRAARRRRRGRLRAGRPGPGADAVTGQLGAVARLALSRPAGRGLRGRLRHWGGDAMSTTDSAATVVELEIGGMTCASCAARIEKKLNRLDGVDGHRQLRHREGARSSSTGRDQRRRRSIADGRGDRLHRRRCRRRPTPAHGGDADRPSRATPTRRRCGSGCVVSAVLGAARCSLLSMIPALQFADWQWVVARPRRAGRASGAPGRSTAPRG